VTICCASRHAGGGGWGDPLTRDPERVRQDVARGMVTPRGALVDYGVMVESASLDVDKSATDAERERRRQPIRLIDRGPGFDEVEARWRAARTQ
jgi:N-methylhydantoinase B